MGQYCFARERLSSVVVCNAAGGRADRPPGAWSLDRRRAGRVGGRAADIAGGPVHLRPVKATHCVYKLRAACQR